MKPRVALIATVLALILQVCFFVISCSKLAEEANSEYESRLQFLGEFSSQFNQSDDPEVRAEFVREMPVSAGTIKGYYAQDGSAVYTSDEQKNQLTQSQMARAKPDKVVLFREEATKKNGYAYAIYQYEDGAFLLFTKPLETVFSEILQHPSLVVFALVFGVSMVLFVSVLLYMLNRERRLDQTMHTLQRFSDGDFDARIKGFPENDPRGEEYNAIIAGIQERIFKQRDRNRVLNSVMTQMQNGIIAVDQNLHITLVTSAAKALLGISGDAERLHVNDASKDVKLDEVFTEAMRSEGVYTNEVSARTTMGRGHRPLRLYVSPMRQNGDVVGALAIVEDITELKRLEQFRTDFASNVSHELKTPLTSILGFVETLENGAIDNPEMARKFINIIKMEVDRLTRLINDILSITKLESGKTPVTTEPVSVDARAQYVCRMLEPQANAKNVTIHCRTSDAPIYIMCNKDQLQQMLINLIENAIKYNVEGGSVTVQVFADEKVANISISDTGIGIAEENLPRLFERFYRVDKGRSRQMGGTGLGLAIVKHIVSNMNGTIEVQSKLGEGTEFLVTLPRVLVDNPEKESLFDDI